MWTRPTLLILVAGLVGCSEAAGSTPPRQQAQQTPTPSAAGTPSPSVEPSASPPETPEYTEDGKLIIRTGPGESAEVFCEGTGPYEVEWHPTIDIHEAPTAGWWKEYSEQYRASQTGGGNCDDRQGPLMRWVPVTTIDSLPAAIRVACWWEDDMCGASGFEARRLIFVN